VFDGIVAAELPEDDVGTLMAIRVDCLALGLGRVTDAEELIDRTARELPVPPAWLPHVRAQVAIARGDVTSALALLDGVHAEPANARWPVVAVTLLATALGLAGDAARAIALLDQALTEPGDGADLSIRRLLLAPRGLLGLLGGYFAETPVEQAYAAAVSGGDRAGMWLGAVMMGMLVASRGEAGAARRWAAEVAALTSGSLPSGMMTLSHAVRAGLWALVGEAEQAATALGEMEAVRQVEVGSIAGNIAAARCSVAAVYGDLGSAQSMALEAADRAAALGQYAVAVISALNAARYGQLSAAAERVGPIAGRMTGPLLPVMARHVLAWQSADAEGVEAASLAYGAIGANLLAAEAAITATRLHQEAGHRTAAAVSAARAASLAEKCAGCRTPILDAGPRQSPLTAREHQISQLATHGLTNRQIGSRLGISTRTVETHLHRAYDKLGVRTRSELSSTLG
jgi:ATP/maltotriose-dependent transcriptional regulator MalT